jgi:hypothetical protein
MGASEIEVIALCTVAVRMALVNTRTAKAAVNPATVSKAFKARMSDSRVLRGTLYGQKRSLQFAVPAAPHLYCGKPEWCLNLGLSVGVDADHPRSNARRAHDPAPARLPDETAKQFVAETRTPEPMRPGQPPRATTSSTSVTARPTPSCCSRRSKAGVMSRSRGGARPSTTPRSCAISPQRPPALHDRRRPCKAEEPVSVALGNSGQ